MLLLVFIIVGGGGCGGGGWKLGVVVVKVRLTIPIYRFQVAHGPGHVFFRHITTLRAQP